MGLTARRYGVFLLLVIKMFCSLTVVTCRTLQATQNVHATTEVPALKMPEVPSDPPTTHFQTVPSGVALGKCEDLCWDTEVKSRMGRPHTPPRAPHLTAHTTLFHVIGVFAEPSPKFWNPPECLKNFSRLEERGEVLVSGKGAAYPSSRTTCHDESSATFPRNHAPERTWDRFASGSPTTTTITGTRRRVTGRRNSRLPTGKAHELTVLA